MLFITVMQYTENARAGGEIKRFILASTPWYDIFAPSFYFCDMYLLQFPNRSRKIYL